jgi:hypothetical protein
MPLFLDLIRSFAIQALSSLISFGGVCMMRRILLAVLLIAISMSVALGQSTMSKPSQSNEEQNMLRLEQDWMGAMQRRDEATLNRLVSPEFTLAGISEMERPPLPKSVWMDNTLHNLKIESFSFDKTKIRIFGNTAMVQAIFTWKGAFNNEPFTDTVVLIDTWVRQSGHWKVVCRLIEDYKKLEDAR